MQYCNNKVPECSNVELPFKRIEHSLTKSMIVFSDHLLPFPSSIKLCMVNLNAIFVANLAQLLNIKLVFLCEVEDWLCPVEKQLGKQASLLEGVFVL